MIVIVDKNDVRKAHKNKPSEDVVVGDLYPGKFNAATHAMLTLYVPTGHMAYVLDAVDASIVPGTTYSHHDWPRLVRKTLERDRPCEHKLGESFSHHASASDGEPEVW